MNLIDVKSALNILGNLYKNRDSKEGKFKYEIYKIVKQLSKNFKDVVDDNYSIYEEYGLKDGEGNLMRFDYNPKYSIEKVEYKDSKYKGYYVAVKTFDKASTFVILEEDYEEVTNKSKDILHTDFRTTTLEINPSNLLNYNISGEDLDILVALGIFRIKE